MEERIKKLLEHIINTAKISGKEDIEIAASVFLGSIENNCVNEFADECEIFTQKKVKEIIFINDVERMINLN